ncbi:Txe/YoeB family addiction module toxin [uncultured Sphingomonas sp.]|uniref:Txe/YoeB family addiction module toxin n=1 Tax=uncultured Sphingomonas sp. TaxID=158754 RepID=UPI0035CB6E05
MKLTWDEPAWLDYVAWQGEDAKIAVRINVLIRECLKTPFAGTGKPEPLRHELKGYWSRRITAEHRLIYRVSGTGKTQSLEIIQCRLHY